MNPSFDRDLSAVFNTADFGEYAISESAGRIAGIFDNGEFVTDNEYGRQTTRTKATFTTRSSYAIAEDEWIIIRDHKYRVAYPVDDGAGVVELQLEFIE